MGLKCQIRKVRYRSYKGEVGKVAPNMIGRDFATVAPNRKWATDVTQINIGFTKLYLSPILDMFNGEIISYNISTSPNLEQVYDMLDKAFARFERLDGLILHSDQGWQYQHYGYRKRMEVGIASYNPKHVKEGKLSGQLHDGKLLWDYEVGTVVC